VRKENKSFTLLELILSVAILAVTISGLLATFIYCLLLNHSNQNLVVACVDAQYVLEQIKGLTYDKIDDYIEDFDPYTFSHLPNETITFPDTNIGPRLANITVNVTWQERQNSRSLLLSTKIAKTKED